MLNALFQVELVSGSKLKRWQAQREAFLVLFEIPSLLTYQY
jgi:hypothetical protein